MTPWTVPGWVGRAALGLLLAGLACENQAGDRPVERRDEGALTAAGQPCDSARAARVAIDSLARLDPFPSTVFRYEPDSTGVRIVTWPAPAGQPISDGMAIIRLDRQCRVASLVHTDSA